MTASQVRWASTHDWFLSSKMNILGSYLITVRDYVHDITTDYFVETELYFTDINKLKEWAGY